MRGLLLIVLSVVSTCLTSAASTYVVNSEGTGCFATIQDALLGVVDGDIIELQNGTYTGEGNRNVDFLGKAVTIRSQSGDPQLCVIDCEGVPGIDQRGFLFMSGETQSTVLQNVTISNGSAAWGGGALRCTDQGGPGSPLVQGCVFVANTSPRGGAVCCHWGASPTFEDCLFISNSATSVGGACFAQDNSPEFNRCTFEGNVSGNLGGAVYASNTAGVRLIHCNFSMNEAEGYGGGAIYVTDSDNCQLVRSYVLDNVSPDGIGGGIGCTNGDLTVFGCVLTGNSSPSGAALWGQSSSIQIVSTTMARNAASLDAVVVFDACHQLGVLNSIIAFSSDGAAIFSSGAVPILGCCDLYANSDGDWTGSIADQYGIDGNISEDPLFCAPELGDLTIAVSSPCAPFTPPNEECDLVGAEPVACGETPSVPRSWGWIKARFSGR